MLLTTPPLARAARTRKACRRWVTLPDAMRRPPAANWAIGTIVVVIGDLALCPDLKPLRNPQTNLLSSCRRDSLFAQAMEMAGKRNRQMGFGDDLLVGRVSADHRLLKLERRVDWSACEAPLGSLSSHTGRPSPPPLVMFKMPLLEHWFDLSDAEVEAQTRVRIDFLCFLGLTLTDPVLDETALVRFRQRPMQKNLLTLLFDRLNEQPTAKGLLVKQGTLIDGSLVRSARTPPPKDGVGSADPEAGYGVRRNTVMHGYKAHVAVDAESEIVRAVIATPANVHDSVLADELVQGDEGRRERLKAEHIAPRMLYRACRNRPLTAFRKTMRRRWSVVRSAAERIFADWQCRRSMARCRYVGLAKNQLHILLLAMAHNLRRMAVLCG